MLCLSPYLWDLIVSVMLNLRSSAAHPIRIMASNQPLLEKKQVQAKRSPQTFASTAWAYFRLTRLHKFPAGSDLIFWPSAWGVMLCARTEDLEITTVCAMILLYALGGTLRHGAGCCWNDICDVEFDRQVERSKSRPLASGAISMTGALALFAAHYAVLYYLLTLAGDEAFKVGLVGLYIIDLIYPLMKRFTHWPQAILGLAMTWGLPTAWVSIRGYSDIDAAVVLYFGGVCWTIYYDTIYACQDRRDDIKAGVKSTAVLFGDWIRPILSFFAACFVASLVYAGVITEAGWLYYTITVGGAAACFAKQMLTIDFDNGEQCWQAFKTNGTLVGFLVWAGMAADYAAAVGLISL
ncbi:UbiA prenyltransferase [Dichomitus squalens]|uniref:4-hydroxybenzoate polyprenyltransferase, mitochondrial n=1 Tax=Dichomitus squalens TaxID=114155 RepID=A0A4Q9MWG2_9APHY|nr:UbiA prenyltransferase [Dichomitus squalens]